MNLIALLFAAALLGIITGAIAQKKGYSFFVWWLFGTAIFLVALIIILVLPPNTVRPGGGRNAPARACPYCGAGAGGSNQCPECRRTLPDFGTASVGSWEKTVARQDDIDKWSQKNPGS